jgi:prevent-host-death family protein
MYYAPQIEPVTKMTRDHRRLLDQTRNGPVHLTQHGVETAVLISAGEWRAIVRRLEQLERMRSQARLARSNHAYAEWQADPTQAVGQGEYAQLLAAAGLVE